MNKDQIPAGEVLRTVTAPDGSVIQAVHYPAIYSLDVECTACGSPYTLLLSRDCTKDAVKQHRAAFAENADKHADTRHAKPCVDSAGGPQS